MTIVMKIWALELVAIYQSFLNKFEIYFFDHLFFTRKFNMRDSGIGSETKGLLQLFILLDLWRVIGIVKINLPLGHFYFIFYEKFIIQKVGDLIFVQMLNFNEKLMQIKE